MLVGDTEFIFKKIKLWAGFFLMSHKKADESMFKKLQNGHSNFK